MLITLNGLDIDDPKPEPKPNPKPKPNPTVDTKGGQLPESIRERVASHLRIRDKDIPNKATEYQNGIIKKYNKWLSNVYSKKADYERKDLDEKFLKKCYSYQSLDNITNIGQ